MTSKPIPVPDQDSEGFWAATSAGRLVVQHCRSCAAIQFYPRLFCTTCHSSELDLIETSGLGEVYSFTVVRRAGSPAFAADVPYVIALVRLDAGAMLMANIVGSDSNDVHIGIRVQASFDDRRGEVAVPSFRLIDPVATGAVTG